ncbi:MAG TPA: hypothetical protein VK659_10235 [Asanoa sp.]|nr:hypothetical protein [Asanoa sp.]
MKPGGVLLVVAGLWVLAQVLGGNALVRLGLITDTGGAGNDVDNLIPAPPGGRKGSTDGRGLPL